MEITKELWGKGLLLTIVVALFLSGCGKINIDTAPVADLDEMCLHFTALENNSVILIVNHGGNKPDVKIKQYGLWKKWDYSLIVLSKGQTIYMKGDNPNGFSTGRAKFSQIATIGKISSGGNVLSLLYEKDFNKRTSVPEYGLYNIFNGSYGLVSAPDLPATELAKACYAGMFMGCKALEKAPELPSKELADSCYYAMFDRCISLKTVPVLPATRMKESCYSYMFWGCESITTAPELPATTLANSCYAGMFKDCVKIVKAPELPATTMFENCYHGMFWHCSSLSHAPALPATKLEKLCYSSMFGRCSSLKTPPRLPATQLADGCYFFMFQGSGIEEAPDLPATELESSCYSTMFAYCSALKKAPDLPSTTLATSCYYNMFKDCTNLETAPVLPATTLVPGCYREMFNGCASLKFIKMGAIDISAKNCLLNWTEGVASEGTFIKNEKAEWDIRGYDGIPFNWTVSEASEFFSCPLIRTGRSAHEEEPPFTNQKD